jgi:6-pyruvoyltetrahydropterin/6-carboxytetrahydropterin synthase
MYRLEKDFTFEASHRLPKHDGKCQRLHGHSWRMTLILLGAELNVSGPKAGMLMDYAEVSAIVKPYVEDYLDHWHLNESLAIENPTSEAIAKRVYEDLRVKLPLLVGVKIHETCTSACLYSEVLTA